MAAAVSSSSRRGKVTRAAAAIGSRSRVEIPAPAGCPELADLTAEQGSGNFSDPAFVSAAMIASPCPDGRCGLNGNQGE